MGKRTISTQLDDVDCGRAKEVAKYALHDDAALQVLREEYGSNWAEQVEEGRKAGSSQWITPLSSDPTEREQQLVEAKGIGRQDTGTETKGLIRGLWEKLSRK